VTGERTVVVPQPGIAGEQGPTLVVVTKPNGTVERTLHAPGSDPTMGVAAVIIATEATGTDEEDRT